MLVFKSKVGQGMSFKIVEYIKENPNKRFLIIDLEYGLDKLIREDNVDFLYGNSMKSEKEVKEFIKMLKEHGDNEVYDLVFVCVNTHEDNIVEYKKLELEHNVKLAVTVQLKASDTQQGIVIESV